MCGFVCVDEVTFLCHSLQTCVRGLMVCKFCKILDKNWVWVDIYKTALLYSVWYIGLLTFLLLGGV